MGRIFFPEEMQDDSESIVISETYWQRKFNRDPQILGKTFRIDGATATIVGVMPAMLKPFYGESLSREVSVLGYNHNIQSSFGVTTQVVDAIRGWVSTESDRASQ